MALHIVNTLSRTKELFTPIDSERITVYQCGPTVYWNQHIGNMRAAVIGDLVKRGLQFLYPQKTIDFVRNYTDVGHLTGENIGDADIGEDKMERAVRREGISVDEIANKYIAQYNADITALNCQMPYMMRATDYIDDMILMVQRLIDAGYAYITPLAVYFDISKKSDYTKLSKQDMSKLLSGHGHGESVDTNKKNAGDFALWFFRTGAHVNALQYWASPFHSPFVEQGYGFPGWHIECSAMAIKKLGETIDIHIGGIEHIPIHHTNEIAQSEGATGQPFVHYWMHHEHILVDNQKMSKSEGTSYLLSDIINRGFSPLDLRYFFLQAHYRSKQNFTWEALGASRTALQRIRTKVERLRNEHTTTNTEHMTRFADAIMDDFNIPRAVGIVHELLSITDAPETYPTLITCDQILGLHLDPELSTPAD